MKLTWTEDLTIPNAPRLREALLAALAESDDVLVDCSSVESVDLAGLQVLAAAAKSASRAGKRLAFAEDGRGPALTEAAERSGFSGASALFGEVSHG